MTLPEEFTSETIKEYQGLLNELTIVELVELIEKRDKEQKLLIFEALSQEKAALVFEFLSHYEQKEVLSLLPSPHVAQILNAISPDDRTALLEELPPDLMHQLLKFLTPQERALSLKLLGYREESIGRLMTPDYIAIKLDWSVEQVLDYVREKGKASETINVIYAVDDQGKLIDDFRIQQFLVTPKESKVASISDHKFLALDVNLDQEKAIEIFRKYGRIALPVIDYKGIMLGIVTIDDIMDAAVEHATEDIQRMGGTGALRETYMHVPFYALLQKRASWLVLLFLGELLTATAMGFFQDEIAKAVVLALFLPLIISSGGNSGSQASTLIVRALALGEVTLRDWWKIIIRELFSGFALGIILGAIGFLRVSIFGYVFKMYGTYWLLISWTIFFSLVGVVLWGTIAGALLPLVLKLLRFDPAAASAPLVATLVDVTGLIIYFSIAILILRGTLL
jgi:magnesium transporter